MQINDNNTPIVEGDTFETELEQEVSFEEQLLDVITSRIEDLKDGPPDYLRQCADLAVNLPLAKDEIRARCFHLIGGSVIFGICIAELPDSYLVSTPAVLTSNNGDVDAKAVGASNVVRLAKAGTSFISLPADDHKFYYYRWLERTHKFECDIFTQERCAVIKQFLYNYKNRGQSVSSEFEPERKAETEDRSKSGAKSDSFWMSSDGKTRH
ncbi:hypothetical protein D3C87_279490 [compost metagenome]